MSNADLADKFFACLVRETNHKVLRNLGDVGALFEHVPSDKETWDLLKQFHRKYNKFPDAELFEEVTGRELLKAKESTAYWYDQLQLRHVKKTMIRASQEANEKMQAQDVMGAFEVISGAVDKLKRQRISTQLFDFREVHDMMAAELAEKKKPDYGIMTGWNTLDSMTGGLRGGDLFSIIGLTGSGKTFMLLFIALYIWKVQKKPVLFVSMEMMAILIFERLTAMDQKIPYNWVKYGEFPTFKGDRKKKFLSELLKLEDCEVPFYVVDGNFATTVEEVDALSAQLGVAAVCVDGAYLLETEEQFRKGNERVGYVCKYLKKSIATRQDIPVLATWQFNKDAMKLKKGQKVGLDNIGDSFEIPRTSSICVGFFQEETAETIRRRRGEILKGRGGEVGEWEMNWNFRQMDFSEIEHVEDFEVLIT